MPLLVERSSRRSYLRYVCVRGGGRNIDEWGGSWGKEGGGKGNKLGR